MGGIPVAPSLVSAFQPPIADIRDRATWCINRASRWEVTVISFELPQEGESEVLEVYLDAEGLSDLLAQLAFLADEKTDHVHLMADSWGGNHLTDTPVEAGARPIRHVKITVR